MSRRCRRVTRSAVALTTILVVATSIMGQVAASAGAFSPGADGIGDPYVPTEGNGGYQVLRYDLDIEFDPATDELAGVATIKARATQDLSAFNFDLYGLTATGAAVDGVAAAVDQVPNELTVTPAAGIVQGAIFTTVVEYGGTPTQLVDPNLGVSGWFNTSDGAIVVGEPEAGMFWFPVNEHPSDKARLCVDVRVPEGLRAVSNGLPEAPPVTDAGWTTWSWCARDPMASYLATVAIGKWRFDRSRTDAGTPVLNYVDRSLPRSADRALARTAEIVGFFASRFGSYPFEAAGGIADNYSSYYALENQTRPTYDEQTVRWGGLVPTVAHEMAHQWYGDSVSLTRWRDIWLNEGFATYAEWMWTAHDGGPSVATQFDDEYARSPGSTFWDLSISDPGYSQLFDGAVYYRGAMTLHALRLKVGDRHFWRILRTWADQNAHGNVRTVDFKQLSEQLAGRQLDRLFREWLVDGDKPPDPR